MEDLKTLLTYGKDAALFCVCIYLIYTEFKKGQEERAFKMKELEKKEDK